MLGILSIVAFLGATEATYAPGTPGIQWTEDQAAIIQVLQIICFRVLDE